MHGAQSLGRVRSEQDFAKVAPKAGQRQSRIEDAGQRVSNLIFGFPAQLHTVLAHVAKDVQEGLRLAKARRLLHAEPRA